MLGLELDSGVEHCHVDPLLDEVEESYGVFLSLVASFSIKSENNTSCYTASAGIRITTFLVWYGRHASLFTRKKIFSNSKNNIAWCSLDVFSKFIFFFFFFRKSRIQNSFYSIFIEIRNL